MTRPGCGRVSGKRSGLRPRPRPRSGRIATCQCPYCEALDLRIPRVEQTPNRVNRFLTHGGQRTDVSELELLVRFSPKRGVESRHRGRILDLVQSPRSDVPNLGTRIAQQIDQRLRRLPWLDPADGPDGAHTNSRRSIVERGEQYVDRRVVVHVSQRPDGYAAHLGLRIATDRCSQRVDCGGTVAAAMSERPRSHFANTGVGVAPQRARERFRRYRSLSVLGKTPGG